MRRLVYTSSARELLSEEILQDILEVSRRNNERDGLTGVLIYHDGCFLQVLEGEGETVSACYSRIERDRRHRDSILMVSEAASSRVFQRWSMAYRSYRSLQGVQQRQFVDIQRLARAASGAGLVGDPTVSAIMLGFLSGFRDLDIAV